MCVAILRFDPLPSVLHDRNAVSVRLVPLTVPGGRHGVVKWWRSINASPRAGEGEHSERQSVDQWPTLSRRNAVRVLGVQLGGEPRNAQSPQVKVIGNARHRHAAWITTAVDGNGERRRVDEGDYFQSQGWRGGEIGFGWRGDGDGVELNRNRSTTP